MIALRRLDTASAEAHQDLDALVGWSPSRRQILTGMLAAAVPTIPAVAVPTIPAVASQVTVSPWMAALINEHQHRKEMFDALDYDADYHDALDAIGPALTDLVHYQPRTAIDFVAKFLALVDVLSDDPYTVACLIEDARALVGEVA